MLNITFAEKFIAYVDVLGFKKLVESSDKTEDNGFLSEVVNTLEHYGSRSHRAELENHGPLICPESAFLNRNLDLRATQISDCVIVSSEVSPAGVINLVQHCWALVLSLLAKGVMCRGYITRGRIYHTESQLVGTGYQKAYESESNVAVFKRDANERGTPFVELDASVGEYVANHGDACTQEMYRRMVKQDGELAAIFPFQNLGHSFVIGDCWNHKFNAERERESNQNVRKMLTEMRTRVSLLVDRSNESAMRKSEHYIRSLDAQLEACDKTDELLITMGGAFPAVRNRQ